MSLVEMVRRLDAVGLRLVEKALRLVKIARYLIGIPWVIGH